MPFTPQERDLLLAIKGVGPTVIARLEQLGVDSLRLLAQADAQQILQQGAQLTGSSCWKNSPQARAAIVKAIQVAQAQPHLASPPRHNTAADETLRQLPNLGPKSAAYLAQAGIHTVEQLQQLGSVAAYAKVKQTVPHISLNLLWALEGALTNTAWQSVARQHRTSLLLALDQLNSPY